MASPKTSPTEEVAPALPGSSKTAAPKGTKVEPLSFSIVVPDLRNGSLTNIQQAAPRASMSVLYHWAVITDLRATDYVPTVEYVIRATYAQLQHVTGTGLTDAVSAELKRKAIVLGAVRAGAAAAYKLTSSDLVRDELVPAGMMYDRGHVEQSANGSTSAARMTAAKSMPDITSVEEAVIALCVYMGMAVPPLQGVSLVMTGHHYVPSTYNLFKGIKKQTLGAASRDAQAWIDAMGETFDDMAFHKACHPVSMTLKRELAKSVDVRERLRASGHGSASIRLPAIPSEASGGKAAVALVRFASGTFRQMGHSISADTGEGLLLVLEHAADAVTEAAACNEVIKWIADNSDKLAFCAGIATHIHETTGTGKNTLLTAYSIKRLMAEHPAEVARGTAYARAANTIMRASMEAGTFQNPAFTM